MNLARCACVLVLAMASPAAAQMSPEQLAATFAYDARAPLDLQESRVETRAGIEVHALSYASPRGGRVPAFLVNPPGKGPFAGIVYMHCGQGYRSEFVA